ncbi:polyphenol oxidase family protein [Nesterenkonia populi]
MTELLWWKGDHDGVRLGFTSAAAGNLGAHVGDAAEAEQNRARLASQLLSPANPSPAEKSAPDSAWDKSAVQGQREGSGFRFLHQVHSTEVLDAGEVRDEVPTADAWVSAGGAAPLGVLVADCLPVLFVGTGAAGPVTAAAHAGREGLLSGVLERTVEALQARGAEEIHAWIGPAACGACYEVPQAMVDEVAAARPALVSTTSWGTPALNLRAEAAAVLRTHGAEVHDVGGCTMEDPQLFSHRRTQQQGAPAGRIAGLVWRA